MARPSSPSVRLTALDAPTMTSPPKRRKPPAQRDQQRLEERHRDCTGQRRILQLHHGIAGSKRHRELDQELALAADAVRGALGDLQVVVGKAEQPETRRDQQHDPDIGIGEIRPEQCRNHRRHQDQQAAHGRRALLFDDVALRAFGADRLALALALAQPGDRRRPHEEGDDEARSGSPRPCGT